MTREETVDLVRSIKSLYPNWKPDNLTDTVNEWHWALGDHSLETVKYELKKYVESGNTFAPSVGNLLPKKNTVYGFTGRSYSHEFFEEIERENERMFR